MNRWSLAPRSGFGIGKVNRKCKPSNLMASLQKQKRRKYFTIALSNGNEFILQVNNLNPIFTVLNQKHHYLRTEKKNINDWYHH